MVKVPVKVEVLCSDCHQPFKTDARNLQGMNERVKGSRCVNCKIIAFELIKESKYF